MSKIIVLGKPKKEAIWKRDTMCLEISDPINTNFIEDLNIEKEINDAIYQNWLKKMDSYEKKQLWWWKS